MISQGLQWEWENIITMYEKMKRRKKTRNTLSQFSFISSRREESTAESSNGSRRMVPMKANPNGYKGANLAYGLTLGYKYCTMTSFYFQT